MNGTNINHCTEEGKPTDICRSCLDTHVMVFPSGKRSKKSHFVIYRYSVNISQLCFYVNRNSARVPGPVGTAANERQRLLSREAQSCRNSSPSRQAERHGDDKSVIFNALTRAVGDQRDRPVL